MEFELFNVTNISPLNDHKGDAWFITVDSRCVFVNGVFASCHNTGYGDEKLSKILCTSYHLFGKTPIHLTYKSYSFIRPLYRMLCKQLTQHQH